MFETHQFDIAVIGLGLMGTSLIKSIAYKNYRIWGLDSNNEAAQYALDNNYIVKNDYDIENAIKNSKIVILSVMPSVAEDIIKKYKHLFSHNTILSDFCGVKRVIYNLCSDINYIGIHTMAGREVGSYKNSDKNLFNNCNAIITTNEHAKKNDINIITNLLNDMGCAKIINATAVEHDEKIAFTSELMHIVAAGIVSSSEYIPSLGFEGNSLMDHTRVGTIDYNMWSEIFAINSDFLENSLSIYINILEDYKKALQNKDEAKLKSLLQFANDNKQRWLHER